MSCGYPDCQLKLETLLRDLYPIFKRIDSLHHAKSLLLIMRELHIILKHFEWLWVTAGTIQVPHLEVRPFKILNLENKVQR
jgi:hypothetical protein